MSVFLTNLSREREKLLSNTATATATMDVSDEDALRADMYDFLASLLRKEPTDELIDKISELAVYGRFSDKMKIVQYQGPGAGIPCQGVD